MKRILTIGVMLAALFAGHDCRAEDDAGWLARMPKTKAAPLSGIRFPDENGPHYSARSAGPEISCEDVILQAMLLTPEVVAGEPVIFRLFIRKPVEAKAAVEFRSRLAFGTDLRAFIVPQGRGRPYEYLANEVGSNVPTGVVTLDRFSVFRLDYRIAMDKDTASGAAFEDPGVYKLKLTHLCGFSSQERKPQDLGEFTITVKAPAGDDAKAMEFLNDFRLFECIQTRAARIALGAKRIDAEQLKLLERVVEQAPKAALRPFVMQVLAEYWEDDHKEPKAVEYLDKIMKEYPGSIPSDEAHLRKIAILEGIRSNDEAYEAFKEAWRDPVVSQLIVPGTNTWKNYVTPFEQQVTATQWMLYDHPAKDPVMLSPIANEARTIVTLTPEAMEDIRKLGGMDAINFKGVSQIITPTPPAPGMR